MQTCLQELENIDGAHKFLYYLRQFCLSFDLRFSIESDGKGGSLGDKYLRCLSSRLRPLDSDR